MSAALQSPTIWAVAAAQRAVCQVLRRKDSDGFESDGGVKTGDEKQPLLTLAFYRKHTESLLRRYLYSSMLIGRSPSILDHPIARGWASSRPVRTFEDAVNFVLDVERCLTQLSSLERSVLTRLVLQEYTIGEAAIIFRVSINTVATKLGIALDRLTGILLKADLLVLPH